MSGLSFRLAIGGGCLSVVFAPGASFAQSGQPILGPIQVPTVIVTAQKEPADAQRLPLSLTAVSKGTVADANLSFVSDAAVYAPNTFFSDFTARKISNPRFRGIGSSPANPGVTTYFDGVPQLSANSSNIELMDIEQLEFVRGPQSALFGRNNLGGLVNVTTSRPSLMDWTGNLSVPFGSHGARDVRGSFSGPVAAGRVGVGGALVYARRDGFTRNLVTGHDLDRRSAFSGKGQLLWTPAATWEGRVIVTGERARDGDYALNDLEALRKNPFEVSRDFEGHTDRDLMNTTILTRHEGRRIAFSTVTGVVRWKTEDATDLDYTPLPLLTRDNTERNFQLTQEVRLASAATAPAGLRDGVTLKWQTGLFLFRQNYEQDAINHYAPSLLSPSLPVPVSQHSPQSTLDDFGVGLYGQGTATFRETLDVSLGARLDYENKKAALNTFFLPAVAPDTVVTADEDFSNVSPQASVAYRVQPGRMVYASMGRGFKAGGFNPASPAGQEGYGEEHTWHLESGVKTSWAGDRAVVNVAVFSINWDDLQLNLPNPFVPGQFYIANVGAARSSGLELEINTRPRAGIDVYGAVGYTHARFTDGSAPGGLDISGNKIPNTPGYTATFGAQLSRSILPAATLRGRAELVRYGGFRYNEANTVGQDAYSIANFTAGAYGTYVFAQFWVRNAFDTRYVPVAFAYPELAPSGFIGEPGRPRAFGLGAGFTF
jgi:iron complex outermembrane recepter protein